METMETVRPPKPPRPPKQEKFTQSITFKGIIIFVMILFLLIPKAMIMGLISERQERSEETIDKINAKWSESQRICGPIMAIPYSITYEERNKTIKEDRVIYVTPENLKINTKLIPEERHYGIYKTILYKSETDISGKFDAISIISEEGKEVDVHWDKVYLTLGVSDLRGITSNVDVVFDGQIYPSEAASSTSLMGKRLIVNLGNAASIKAGKESTFSCKLNLNGSSEINFVPVGKTTNVELSGAWKSPGFIGNFSPEYVLDDNGFNASWNILYFNRNIPESWIDDEVTSFYDSSFGVNLVDTVDHYQQNMRSAKYALMFIALTFVVFFFVELLTKKKIHPVQYLLVGIALILFYSLLLSISEQINFAVAYLIASIATIGLITAYTYSIFKDKTQTAILTLVLCVLYLFLYTILQLEDMALLIGSIGLFVILGIIMFLSRKINWYKEDSQGELE